MYGFFRSFVIIPLLIISGIISVILIYTINNSTIYSGAEISFIYIYSCVSVLCINHPVMRKKTAVREKLAQQF